MLSRILTAVIGIPLVIAVVMLGNPWLPIVLMLASLIGSFELYRVIKKKYHPIVIVGYAGIIINYLVFDILMAIYFVYLAAIMMIALTVMVIYYPKYSIVDVALTLLPVLYVSLLFSFLLIIREMPEGSFWIWLVAISAWGSDTFAYFTGLTIGKHKLAPVLSPKKTIEGSIGGILGAGLLGYIYTMIYTHYSLTQLRAHWLLIVVAVMLGAIISQVGDLAASAIKRYFEQKDYGHLLPGHGGILDRCDSFIFVAPVIYIMMIVAQNIVG